jgi:hypothetical protein
MIFQMMLLSFGKEIKKDNKNNKNGSEQFDIT